MVAAAITPSASRRLIPAHRVLGLAALGLAFVHALSLVATAHPLGWTLVLLLMALWCAKCAWGVWHGAPAQKLLIMSAVMGMLHVVMALGMPWLGEHHHTAGGHSAAHGLPMLLMACAEFALMFWAAILCHIQSKRSSLFS
ncbi:hypothetical protein D3791_04310 [Glutamicibacter mishrai]|uniref:DUF3995 domain-containing protein n=2 Tax=Glutamicibacter mishrai TaxID=1775880 RepID=A0A6H0SFJ0_9MICC|nr:hypothetical protein D3791_04310 [Glutamicibacter mishrai]